MSCLKKLSGILTAGLLTASVAHGQTTAAGGQATGQAGSTVNTQSTQISSEASATAEARAQADLQKLREGIEKKPAKASAEARARAEAQLEATAKQVDAAVQKHGEANDAERLAGEFRVSAQALTAERAQLDATWGQLMIAHTIAANSKTEVTAQQLLALKNEGMGWGKVASGLGLRLASVVSSVKAEGMVASGLAKADGRVAAMRGEGARTGANASVGVQAGVNTGQATAGAGIDVGAGVKVGK